MSFTILILQVITTRLGVRVNGRAACNESWNETKSCNLISLCNKQKWIFGYSNKNIILLVWKTESQRIAISLKTYSIFLIYFQLTNFFLWSAFYLQFRRYPSLLHCQQMKHFTTARSWKVHLIHWWVYSIQMVINYFATSQPIEFFHECLWRLNWV